MTEHDAGTRNDPGASYAIHIAGTVGPMLVQSLSCEASADAAPWDVRTDPGAVVLLSVTEEDLVDVVRRLADDGVEIESVRDLCVGD